MWIVAVVVDFEANKPHSFKGIEERIQHVWVGTEYAWVGE
jgi:hypothetical protein